VRFVQRVARAFETAAERGGPLRLRLSPPELGSLRLEVQLRDGTLQARIEAETPEARGLLLEQLPALRERLAQQQVRLERFDVDVRREGSDGSPHAFDQGRRDEARAERRVASRAAPRGETAAASRTGAEPRAASGRIDVTV
jgi:flagellar hook-length control protein FliK